MSLISVGICLINQKIPWNSQFWLFCGSSVLGLLVEPCIKLTAADLEDDPDFEDIDLNTTQLVYIVKNEKKSAFTSYDTGKVDEQELDYSTPQIWIKENQREDGSTGFFLKSIAAVGFAKKRNIF